MDFIGNAQHLGEVFSVHCAEADLMIRDGQVWIARENRLEPIANLEPESDPVTGFLDYLDGKIENPVPFSAAPASLLASALPSSCGSSRILEAPGGHSGLAR